MTKSELVQAYIRGDLDRRGFIRRLSAVGVSAGAAAVYATSLTHPAVIAADGNGAGFVVRARMGTDPDYGLAVIIENLLEALQAIVDLLRRIIARLEQFLSSLRGTSTFLMGTNTFRGAQQQDEGGQIAVLEDILSQARDHVDALTAIYPELVDTAADLSALDPNATDQEILRPIAEDYNTLAGVYAAVLPNVEDLELRQTMTEIVIVGGRHAALVSHFAGINPVPAAFELPIDPATVE